MVHDFEILGMRPFIPSGADFAAACRFFVELGFEKIWEVEGYAGFARGGANFILQKCFIIIYGSFCSG